MNSWTVDILAHLALTEFPLKQVSHFHGSLDCVIGRTENNRSLKENRKSH